VSPEVVEVDVDGRQLKLSNLSKVLYPEAGFTKGDVIDYYARVAEVMVPHLADRPVTFVRFPNGVEGSSFFEKHAPSHAPEWVRCAAVPRGSNSKSDRGLDVSYVVIDDRPTLVWAANLASLEFHVPQWRLGDGEDLPKPSDLLVFDLDPGEGTSIVECCKVASWLADEIGRDGVVAKTSGSKGLQLYLRLVAGAVGDASELAHELARKLEHDHPDAVVSNMKKALRTNKVLIDWSQNNPYKTTVAVYSMRARPRPTVSTPVTWDEVDVCARDGVPSALEFVATDVLDRIDRMGDLFAPLR
jgi:bifunctional non-homologous end joining protein LigD